MPDSNSNNHRDYSIFDNMDTEKLEDILRADSQLPDSENSDMDAILYIMEVIAKREKEHPTEKIIDVHDAWLSFSKNYLPYIEDDKSLYLFDDTEEKIGITRTPSILRSRPLRKGRLMRTALVAAAVTMLLLVGTVTASAFGFDLWGAVAKWTNDTFGFSTIVSNEEGYPEATNHADENSLQGALNEYGITTNLAPTWFPEGYVLENVDVVETPLRITFLGTYRYDKNEIQVAIAALAEPSTRTYEKDGNDIEVYVSDGNDHYIMSNFDYTNIVWKTGNFECQISGKLSLEDAKKMIDSIYERK